MVVCAVDEKLSGSRSPLRVAVLTLVAFTAYVLTLLVFTARVPALMFVRLAARGAAPTIVFIARYSRRQASLGGRPVKRFCPTEGIVGNIGPMRRSAGAPGLVPILAPMWRLPLITVDEWVISSMGRRDNTGRI